MDSYRYIIALLLLISSYTSRAQNFDLEGRLNEEVMNEASITDERNETLLLDNSRSKIGRDFYDAFFRQYAELSQADTTGRVIQNLQRDQDIFIITIDELPAFGVGTAIIMVTINDQIIWQNYVQARLDVIEASALNAAELASQYVANYQELQQQLDNEDQKGNGIF